MARCFSIVFLGLLAAACGGGSSSPPPDPGPGPIPDPPLTGGLDRRPDNSTCIAPSRDAAAGSELGLERVFAGLGFEAPIAMAQAPGDATRWFVAERAGRVRVFADADDVASFDSDLIDLRARIDTSGEGGLLGFAFHPNFATNGHVYLSWTEPGAPLVSVISRFTLMPGSSTLDPGSEQEILRLNQDFTNHNGGQIAFGPDGFLYIAFGDGGSGGDPLSRGQDTTNLLGAMLRIDVDGGMPYAIPPGNPFEGGAACPADPNVSSGDCPEIYAWGLRNPWRFSFDRATGDLWLGDVGQGAREEVDRIELGGNYGWDCREGTIAHSGTQAASCAAASGLIEPVHDYGRSLGTSITGGYVYRGSALPAIAGQYLFGDFGSGRIWRLEGSGGSFLAEEVIDTSLSIASFGEGNDGELYVIDIAGGGIHRLVDAGGSTGSEIPVAEQLSATGCFQATNPSEPAIGLVPYTPLAAFWSDSADKERWLAIPDGMAIDVAPDGDFDFPAGTVLSKHFRVDGQLVETRLFMRHPDGEWAGYSYEWNAAQSDATLVQGGKTALVAGQEWVFPSENDCLACHTAVAGFSLGLEAAQLNHAIAYPSTGRSANQLLTLDEIGLFASPLGDPSVQPSLVDPDDAGASLDERARAYLHTNCAQCHRPGSPTPSSLNLLFDTELADTNACDAPPQSGDLGIGSAARIVAPGDPGASVLLSRMNVERGHAAAMPPLASNEIDTAGIDLIRAWIEGLAACR